MQINSAQKKINKIRKAPFLCKGVSQGDQAIWENFSWAAGVYADRADRKKILPMRRMVSFLSFESSEEKLEAEVSAIPTLNKIFI